MSSTASIKYQILTFPYFQQARKLIAKEFPTNNIITSGLDIPFSEFRYDNLKFQQNSGLIAIEVKSDRVVGVVLTQDFLTFIQQNQKPITYSQFFEFYRKTFLVPFIKDYLQRYPNLKRGEFSYSYRACIDAQFSNQAIFKGIFMQLHQFNKKRGYKFQIGITHDPKIIRTLDPNRMILTEYKVQNPIFKGKHIRVALNVEPISKL